MKLVNGTHWRPENFTHQLYGPVPVVRALSESLNLATVGVGLSVGIGKVAQTLQRFGLPEPPPQVPAILLGAVDVTPIEAAQLFNGLANGGFRNPLRAVRAVISQDTQDRQGVPAAGDAGGVPRSGLSARSHAGARDGSRHLPDSRLRAGCCSPGLVVFAQAESGASSDFRDSWFGWVLWRVTSPWCGSGFSDSDQPTGFTGSAGALPGVGAPHGEPRHRLWNAPMPESLAEVQIEYPTGLRVAPGCAEDIVAVAVPAGTQLPAKAGCGFAQAQTPATDPPNTLIDGVPGSAFTA